MMMLLLFFRSLRTQTRLHRRAHTLTPPCSRTTQRFTLTGTQINVDDVVKSRAKRPDRATVSLEFDNMREVNDYMAPEEDVNIAFRKSKKKNSKKDGGKAKRTTRVATDRDEEDGFELSKIVDGTPDGGSSSKRATKPRTSTTAPDNFVDDDDLQFALAQSRKVTMKKKSAEEIAREMAEADAADGDDAAATPPTGSIVLSSTTEFVRNLSTTSVVVKPKEVATKEKVAAAATVAAADVTMSSAVGSGAMDVDASTEAVPVVEEPEAEEDAKLVGCMHAA